MSREPLAKEGLIAGGVGLLVQLLLLLGVSDEWAAWFGAAVTFAVAVWIVVRVRPKVTPLADPRDDQGQPLATVREVSPPLTQPQDGDILRDL